MYEIILLYCRRPCKYKLSVAVVDVWDGFSVEAEAGLTHVWEAEDIDASISLVICIYLSYRSTDGRAMDGHTPGSSNHRPRDDVPDGPRKKISLTKTVQIQYDCRRGRRTINRR